MSVRNISALGKWLFLVLSIITLLSCQSKWFTYVGHEVADEDLLAIKEAGSDKGSWDTRDLTLNFAYERNQDDFRLSGKVTWANHLLYNFRLLEHFYLRVYFVDASGTIIEGKSIIFTGHKEEFENLPFDKQYTLPPGTVAMVFSYTGRATEHGSGEGDVPESQIDWDFWKSPVRGTLF